jgi:3',5'-cyclic AMP phosphodiesterase CpdA
MRRVSRRRFLRESGGAVSLAAIGLTAGGAAGLGLAGCGSASGGSGAAADGSTLVSTWADPNGDGQLQVGPGEPLVHRTALGERAAYTRTLGTVCHLTDAHVMDAASPARVPFLARLGPPFQSTFRPHEALTASVLLAAVHAVRALAPDLVLEGGDLIDNVQGNELERALAILHGGEVHPGSGRDGYFGVQSEVDPDPFYYRPQVDAPRHLRLLQDAVKPFRSPGIGAPWLPVLGDHDVLVQGELVPTDLTRMLAVGDRALWTLPKNISVPPGTEVQASTSPDGPPLPGPVDDFLRQALAGPTVKVPADQRRVELSVTDVIASLRRTAGRVGTAERLDYVHDLGDRLRFVVLDLASRTGGSGGQVVDGQADFVRSALDQAGERFVVFVSHQTLRQSVGGDAIQSVLDSSSNVVLTLAGHTHHNRINPRATPHGGYWNIETASLIDYPQQSRALRFHETDAGGIAIETWMLDHAPGNRIAQISRELSFLEAAGGRPGHFAGSRTDRNAVLFRRRA